MARKTSHTPYPTARLADLLPAEAIDEVQALAEQGRCTATNLKPITNRYKDELLKKGVDADYLAYAIEYAATRDHS